MNDFDAVTVGRVVAGIVAERDAVVKDLKTLEIVHRGIIGQRDQSLKRASDATLECGRLEARLEHLERILLRWYNAWLADQDAPEECREAAEAIILRGTPREGGE